MTQVLDLIQGEPLSLLVTLVLFAYVGNWAVGGHQKVRAWGWRLAFAAFVAYVAYAIWLDGLGDAGLLAAAGFRGLLAGGLVLGASWIALAVGSFVVGNLVGSASARVRRLQSRQEQKRREQERERSEKERQRQERARAAGDLRMHEQKEQREQQQRQELGRRKDARAAALRAYSLYAPKIGERFSRAMFDEYLRDFMGDDSPAEDVERRGEELLAIFERHTVEIAPPAAERGLEDLASWFLDHKTRIEALSLDDRLKRRLVAQLNARYAELTTEFLEELTP